MAQAHDLLTERSWTGAHLTDIVERILNTFAPTQLAISGPAVEVSARHALALSMALHELATNAIKYGALSCQKGQVTVRWRIQDATLHLDWEEHGGPRSHTRPEKVSAASFSSAPSAASAVKLSSTTTCEG